MESMISGLNIRNYSLVFRAVQRGNRLPQCGHQIIHILTAKEITRQLPFTKHGPDHQVLFHMVIWSWYHIYEAGTNFHSLVLNEETEAVQGTTNDVNLQDSSWTKPKASLERLPFHSKCIVIIKLLLPKVLEKTVRQSQGCFCTGVLLYRTPASCEVSGQSRWMSLQKAKGLGLPRWPDGPWPRSWCIHMLVNDICYFQFPAFTVTQRPCMEFLLREVFLSYFLWFSININWS